MAKAEARAEASHTADRVRAGRRQRARRRGIVVAVLAVLVFAMFVVSLMVGQSVTPLGDVIRVVFGQEVQGATFTVGVLRLPRAVLALAVGICFGMAGISFQTLLRNQLASPDIIGVGWGASTAAVLGIVSFGWTEAQVSFGALAGAIVTILAIYGLSHRGRFAGTRLVLIGIGISSMLASVVSYILVRAAAWDLQTALRWLNGNLNGASWQTALPVVLAVAVVAPLLIVFSRNLGALQLGDDSAASLGVRVSVTRLVLLIGAVALLAFATAASGPVAFVAFMSGPIAARLVGPGSSLLVPSALVGALLVLAADFIGQHAFPTTYPVGVVTGVLGAPFLIALLVRANRAGGTL